MAFNFTRAAFLDRRARGPVRRARERLVNGRFWLPRRQEIEIRRGGTWLDYPDSRHHPRPLGDRRLRREHRALAGDVRRPGDRARAASASADTLRFGGRILDSLPPDVRAVTDADVRRVQEEARALVRAQALRRPQALTLVGARRLRLRALQPRRGVRRGRRASRRGSAAGTASRLRGRYGIDDREGKGERRPDVAIAPLGRCGCSAMRDFRDAGDVQERSRLVNSIAAQEFGSDATDPYGVQGGGVGLDARRRQGLPAPARRLARAPAPARRARVARDAVASRPSCPRRRCAPCARRSPPSAPPPLRVPRHRAPR